MDSKIRFAIGPLVVAASFLLVADYAWVRSKERRLSSAVEVCSGKMGSIPLWPLGTEYRITFDRPLRKHEIEQLDIANRMRGSVGIALRNWDLSKAERDNLANVLWACDVFIVLDDQTTVRISDLYFGSNP